MGSAELFSTEAYITILSFFYPFPLIICLQGPQQQLLSLPGHLKLHKHPYTNKKIQEWSLDKSKDGSWQLGTPTLPVARFLNNSFQDINVVGKTLTTSKHTKSHSPSRPKKLHSKAGTHYQLETAGPIAVAVVASCCFHSVIVTRVTVGVAFPSSADNGKNLPPLIAMYSFTDF